MWRILKAAYLMLAVLFISALCGGCSGLLPGKGGVELVRAIPENAAFIIKLNDPASFSTRLQERPYQNVVTELLPAELLANHNSVKSFLETGQFTEAGRSIPLLASLHLASADKLNSIHYFPLGLSGRAYSRQLDEHFPGTARQQWNYEGVDFNEVLLTDLNIKLTTAYTGGILIASPMAFLVEDAVKQLKSGSTLLNDSEFKKVYQKETDQADASIWMPFANSKHWLTLFASENGMELLAGLQEFAGWILMDIYLNEKEIFMSGIASAKKGNRLGVIGQQNSCSSVPNELLPLNTAASFQYSGVADSIAKALKPFGLGGCLSKLMLEPLNTALRDHMVYLLPIQDDEVYQKAKTQEKEMKEMLGRMFLNSAECEFRTVSGYAVFSSSSQSLNNFTQNVSDGRVLAKDAGFLEFQKNLKTDARVTSYVRAAYHRETFNALYASPEDAMSDHDAFKGFSQAAIQFSKQGDIFLVNATLAFDGGDVTSHTNLAWNAELDAPVLAGPTVVALDLDGAMGVLVQDMDFNIYLFDKSGNVAWKRKLDSPWMGSSYSLALFEGSGNAIAFNTESNWYLVDESGSDMAGFPLHFKDLASAPMSMIRSGTSHLVFIPSVNGNLYGYELNGKPLPGWNPKERAGVVRHAPLLTSVGGEVYITATNEEGMAYVWRRNGTKTAGNAFKNSFPSEHFIDKQADPFKLKNVKEDGELVSMNAAGSVGNYQLPVSGVSQFAMADVQGNSEPEIIINTGDEIWLFDYRGQLIWKRKLAGHFSLVEVADSDKSVIACHDKGAKSMQVLDGEGKPMLENALQAGDRILLTADDLWGTGQYAFITSGSENELKCYNVSLGGK